MIFIGDLATWFFPLCVLSAVAVVIILGKVIGGIVIASVVAAYSIYVLKLFKQAYLITPKAFVDWKKISKNIILRNKHIFAYLNLSVFGVLLLFVLYNIFSLSLPHIESYLIFILTALFMMFWLVCSFMLLGELIRLLRTDIEARKEYMFAASQIYLIKLFFDWFRIPYNLVMDSMHLHKSYGFFRMRSGDSNLNYASLNRKIKKLDSVSARPVFFPCVKQRLREEVNMHKAYVTVRYVMLELRPKGISGLNPAIITDMTGYAFSLYQQGQEFETIIRYLKCRFKMDQIFDNLGNRNALFGIELQAEMSKKSVLRHQQFLVNELGYYAKLNRRYVDEGAPPGCPQVLIHNIGNQQSVGLFNNQISSMHISVGDMDHNEEFLSVVTACLWLIRSKNKRLFYDYANPSAYSKGLIRKDNNVMDKLNGVSKPARWEIRVQHLTENTSEDLYLAYVLLGQGYDKELNANIMTLLKKFGYDNSESVFTLFGSTEYPAFEATKKEHDKYAVKAAQLESHKNLLWLKEASVRHPEMIDEVKQLLQKHMLCKQIDQAILALSDGRITEINERVWSYFISLLDQQPEGFIKKIIGYETNIMCLAVLSHLGVDKVNDVVETLGVEDEFKLYQSLLMKTELGAVMLRPDYQCIIDRSSEKNKGQPLVVPVSSTLKEGVLRGLYGMFTLKKVLSIYHALMDKQKHHVKDSVIVNKFLNEYGALIGQEVSKRYNGRSTPTVIDRVEVVNVREEDNFGSIILDIDGQIVLLVTRQVLPGFTQQDLVHEIIEYCVDYRPDAHTVAVVLAAVLPFDDLHAIFSSDPYYKFAMKLSWSKNTYVLDAQTNMPVPARITCDYSSAGARFLSCFCADLEGSKWIIKQGHCVFIKEYDELRILNFGVDEDNQMMRGLDRKSRSENKIWILNEERKYKYTGMRMMQYCARMSTLILPAYGNAYWNSDMGSIYAQYFYEKLELFGLEYDPVVRNIKKWELPCKKVDQFVGGVEAYIKGEVFVEKTSNVVISSITKPQCGFAVGADGLITQIYDEYQSGKDLNKAKQRLMEEALPLIAYSEGNVTHTQTVIDLLRAGREDLMLSESQDDGDVFSAIRLAFATEALNVFTEHKTDKNQEELFNSLKLIVQRMFACMHFYRIYQWDVEARFALNQFKDEKKIKRLVSLLSKEGTLRKALNNLWVQYSDLVSLIKEEDINHNDFEYFSISIQKLNGLIRSLAKKIKQKDSAEIKKYWKAINERLQILEHNLLAFGYLIVHEKLEIKDIYLDSGYVDKQLPKALIQKGNTLKKMYRMLEKHLNEKAILVVIQELAHIEPSQREIEARQIMFKVAEEQEPVDKDQTIKQKIAADKEKADSLEVSDDEEAQIDSARTIPAEEDSNVDVSGRSMTVKSFAVLGSMEQNRQDADKICWSDMRDFVRQANNVSALKGALEKLLGELEDRNIKTDSVIQQIRDEALSQSQTLEGFQKLCLDLIRDIQLVDEPDQVTISLDAVVENKVVKDEAKEVSHGLNEDILFYLKRLKIAWKEFRNMWIITGTQREDIVRPKRDLKHLFSYAIGLINDPVTAFYKKKVKEIELVDIVRRRSMNRKNEYFLVVGIYQASTFTLQPLPADSKGNLIEVQTKHAKKNKVKLGPTEKMDVLDLMNAHERFEISDDEKEKLKETPQSYKNIVGHKPGEKNEVSQKAESSNNTLQIKDSTASQIIPMEEDKGISGFTRVTTLLLVVAVFASIIFVGRAEASQLRTAIDNMSTLAVAKQISVNAYNVYAAVIVGLLFSGAAIYSKFSKQIIPHLSKWWMLGIVASLMPWVYSFPRHLLNYQWVSPFIYLFLLYGVAYLILWLAHEKLFGFFGSNKTTFSRPWSLESNVWNRLNKKQKRGIVASSFLVHVIPAVVILHSFLVANVFITTAFLILCAPISVRINKDDKIEGFSYRRFVSGVFVTICGGIMIVSQHGAGKSLVPVSEFFSSFVHGFKSLGGSAWLLLVITPSPGFRLWIDRKLLKLDKNEWSDREENDPVNIPELPMAIIKIRYLIGMSVMSLFIVGSYLLYPDGIHFTLIGLSAYLFSPHFWFLLFSAALMFSVVWMLLFRVQQFKSGSNLLIAIMSASGTVFVLLCTYITEGRPESNSVMLFQVFSSLIVFSGLVLALWKKNRGRSPINVSVGNKGDALIGLRPLFLDESIVTFESMAAELKNSNRRVKIVVPVADFDSALGAVALYLKEMGKRVRIILIGDKQKIKEIWNGLETGISLRDRRIKIHRAADKEKAFQIAMKMIHKRKADIILKGNTSTDELMAVAFKKEEDGGLRLKDQGITHLRGVEVPEEGVALLTDGGINIQSSISKKKIKRIPKNREFIHANAVEIMRLLGKNIKDLFIWTSEQIDPFFTASLKVYARRSSRNAEVVHGAPLEKSLDHGAREKLQDVLGVSGLNRKWPNIMELPWIGPANIIYKSLVQLPWRLRHIEDIYLRHGVLSLFSKDGKVDNFLVVAAPEEGADYESKRLFIEEIKIALSNKGIDHPPKIALLDFTEKPEAPQFNSVPSLIQEVQLVKYFENDELCEVEGPMAYDIAVYPNGVDDKGYMPNGEEPKVAGNPDVLFVPDNVTGILLREVYLQWDKLGLPWKACDLSWGGLAPIIIASRSDSSEHKHRSIVMAEYLMMKRDLENPKRRSFISTLLKLLSYHNNLVSGLQKIFASSRLWQFIKNYVENKFKFKRGKGTGVQDELIFYFTRLKDININMFGGAFRNKIMVKKNPDMMALLDVKEICELSEKEAEAVINSLDEWLKSDDPRSVHRDFIRRMQVDLSKSDYLNSYSEIRVYFALSRSENVNSEEICVEGYVVFSDYSEEFPNESEATSGSWMTKWQLHPRNRESANNFSQPKIYEGVATQLLFASIQRELEYGVSDMIFYVNSEEEFEREGLELCRMYYVPDLCAELLKRTHRNIDILVEHIDDYGGARGILEQLLSIEHPKNKGVVRDNTIFSVIFVGFILLLMPSVLKAGEFGSIWRSVDNGHIILIIAIAALFLIQYLLMKKKISVEVVDAEEENSVFTDPVLARNVMECGALNRKIFNLARLTKSIEYFQDQDNWEFAEELADWIIAFFSKNRYVSEVLRDYKVSSEFYRSYVEASIFKAGLTSETEIRLKYLEEAHWAIYLIDHHYFTRDDGLLLRFIETNKKQTQMNKEDYLISRIKEKEADKEKHEY